MIYNYIRTHIKNPETWLENPSEMGQFSNETMVGKSTKDYFLTQFKYV
jgi:hypothetical protein